MRIRWRLVYLTDVAPTIRGLAGVAAPPSMEVQSLVALAKRGKRGSGHTVMFAYRNVQRPANVRWKLIVY